MKATVDYTNFVGQISSKLVDDGLFDHEWISSQRNRLSIMWAAGETVKSAYETIRIFAEAQLGSSTIKHLDPLSFPHCIGVRNV